MNTYLKIIIVLAGLIYLLSPLDIIPDFFIPYLGWIDDTFIIGLVLYLLKFGRLPGVFNKRGTKSSFFKTKSDPFHHSRNFYSKNRSRNQENPGRNYQKENPFDGEQQQVKKDPYEILGVNRKATREEIQSAYKKKVKQYHPDKVSHLGEELQKMANQKFVEIKDAYDLLMKTV